jgi:hypothetical protein
MHISLSLSLLHIDHFMFCLTELRAYSHAYNRIRVGGGFAVAAFLRAEPPSA